MTNCCPSDRKRITVLVGLPGSGKTHFGLELVAQTGGLFIDDVDKNGGLAAVMKAIEESVPHLILSDPHLCDRVAQERARKFLERAGWVRGYDIVWRYFENDVVKCQNNVNHRNKLGDVRKVGQAIELWSKIYCLGRAVIPPPSGGRAA